MNFWDLDNDQKLVLLPYHIIKTISMNDSICITNNLKGKCREENKRKGVKTYKPPSHILR